MQSRLSRRLKSGKRDMPSGMTSSDVWTDHACNVAQRLVEEHDVHVLGASSVPREVEQAEHGDRSDVRSVRRKSSCG